MRAAALSALDVRVMEGRGICVSKDSQGRLDLGSGAGGKS